MGEEIASGKTLEQVLASMVMVAEGVRTTKSAKALSERHGIEMPITEQMHCVLFEDRDPREAISELMNREPKSEAEGR